MRLLRTCRRAGNDAAALRSTFPAPVNLCPQALSRLPPGACLEAPTSPGVTADGFLPVSAHSRVLDGMLQSHAAGRDICLVGPRGGGKSTVARELARRVQQPVVVINLYKDMTTRELLQVRRLFSEMGKHIRVAGIMMLPSLVVTSVLC